MLSHRGGALVALSVLAGAWAPAGASAQEPLPESAESTEAPPAEASPSEALTGPAGPLVAPDGYGDPTLPPLRARAPAGRRVSLYALRAGSSRPLTLHARRADGGPTERCTAPCRLDVDQGRYVLSVEPRGGGPRTADDMPVRLEGDRLAVTMTYDHRVGLRSLGWTFFCLAVSAFAVSWVGGIFTALIIGAPLPEAFLIPFLPLVPLNDSARVEVTPLPQ